MEEKILTCPDCGGDYLHQLECSAIWRKEDQDGACYTSARGKFSFEDVDADKISGRRDTLEIAFMCEGCHPDERKHLEIYQHKGQTFMRWVL